MTGNSASDRGGGLYNRSSGTVTVQNSTLSGNSAYAAGGGMLNTGTATVQNSIVANSTNGDLAGGGAFHVDSSLIEDNSQTGTGANNLSADPNLGPLQNNGGPTFTHALLSGTTAINAGNNALAAGLTTDQRGVGFARIAGSRVDIGAFEAAVTPLIAVGTDAGVPPRLRVFNADGTLRFNFRPYPVFVTGGVRVATGDVNGDSFDDIIVSPGAGYKARIKVFDGRTGALLRDFQAFGRTIVNGVYVGAGDIDRDGFADIIIGAGAGMAPRVRVFSGQNNALLRDFRAYPPAFRGGVRVAGGDLNRDGFADIITGTGPGVRAQCGPSAARTARSCSNCSPTAASRAAFLLLPAPTPTALPTSSSALMPAGRRLSRSSAVRTARSCKPSWLTAGVSPAASAWPPPTSTATASPTSSTAAGPDSSRACASSMGSPTPWSETSLPSAPTPAAFSSARLG
ncbi:MAG: FG-GAP-like repeat-containing protein [Gemmataceae bacterium]|nr:FG-GAP-like repeat-containing protein [Gemmataceae bacterium]